MTVHPDLQSSIKLWLETHESDHKLSFSRPGFITLKSDISGGFRNPGTLIWAHLWGKSWGAAKPEDLIDKLLALRERPELAKAQLALWRRPGLEDRDCLAPTVADFPGLERLINQIPEPVCLEGDRWKPKQIYLSILAIDSGKYWIVSHTQDGNSLPYCRAPLVEPKISRAYVKVIESTAYFEIPWTRGDSCLEFGSAPGGASTALLEQGLLVVGVDPSPVDRSLADRLIHLPVPAERLVPNDLKTELSNYREFAEFYKGPEWLVADINLGPKQVFPILEPWLPRVRKGVLWTLKMVRREVMEEIAGLTPAFKRHGFTLKLKQLASNGKELMAYAARNKGTFGSIFFATWLATLIGGMASNPALAWTDHFRITRAALKTQPDLTEVKVPYRPLEDFLNSQNGKFGKTQAEFNEKIEIRKDFVFAPKLGEGPDKELGAIDILSTYSDEPDWDMDKELYDQYPQLWNPVFEYMGGRVGTPTQSPRHMYWDRFHFSKPIQTFKWPPKILLVAMGAAPQRARVFIDLARAAKQSGQNYWCYRFIANAIHYLEDITQPFHAAQLPSKKFLLMPFRDRNYGSGFDKLVAQVQNVVSYYHFAYEDYIAYLFKPAVGSDSVKPEAAGMEQALIGKGGPPEGVSSDEIVYYRSVDPEGTVVKAAQISQNFSAESANSAIEFFPVLDAPYATVSFTGSNTFMNAAWWAKTIENGKRDSTAKKDYFRSVEAMFYVMGRAVESLVKAEKPNIVR